LAVDNSREFSELLANYLLGLMLFKWLCFFSAASGFGSTHILLNVKFRNHEKWRCGYRKKLITLSPFKIITCSLAFYININRKLTCKSVHYNSKRLFKNGKKPLGDSFSAASRGVCIGDAAEGWSPPWKLAGKRFRMRMEWTSWQNGDWGSGLEDSGTRGKEDGWVKGGLASDDPRAANGRLSQNRISACQSPHARKWVKHVSVVVINNNILHTREHAINKAVRAVRQKQPNYILLLLFQ